MKKMHYGRLFVMLLLSFIAMYGLMYAMVDSFANVYPSYNQIYMAGLMTAAMLIIELALMGAMYPNKKMNALLMLVGIIALGLFWMAIRQQTAINDRQFLKSMIPHHSGAILMCQEAKLRDAQIQALCRTIITGQQEEINQMKSILDTLQK